MIINCHQFSNAANICGDPSITGITTFPVSPCQKMKEWYDLRERIDFWLNLQKLPSNCYAKEHPSQIRRSQSNMRLRQQVRDPCYKAGVKSRYLQCLPSVLHGQIEVRRYRWPDREIQE
jgi:hypothetical protein